MNATTDSPERARPTADKSLIVRLAERLHVDAEKLMSTLKATAFRQRADDRGNVREPTDEEMMALLILADTYKLNPFTRELFAYYDPKSKAIIAVVSVDGWVRIINDQPSLRSLSFRYSEETVKHKGKTCHVWMECVIKRSDRDEPIVIREYFAEVVREVSYATPWDSHPNRMHRHKTLIQAGRVAFGFGGIYDDDEAARIIEGESHRVADAAPAAGVAAINSAVAADAAPAAIEHNPGQTVPGPVVAETVHANPITAAQHAAGAPGYVEKQATPEASQKPEKAAGVPILADVLAGIEGAATLDALNVATDLIRALPDPAHKRHANLAAADRRKALLAGNDGT